MSANNFILIEKVKDKFVITHRDYDTGRVLDKLGSVKNAESALLEANKFIGKMNNEGMSVEYGIEFSAGKK